jgi:hypothetical protein
VGGAVPEVVAGGVGDVIEVVAVAV